MRSAPPTTKSPAAPASPQRKRARLHAAVRRLEQYERPAGEQRVALAEAYFRLAMLPDAEPQEAVACLQKAIAQDPFHPKLFFHLARLLHRHGDPRGAVAEYRRALRLAPDSHRTLVHLALALLELGKGEKEIGRGLLEALEQGSVAKREDWIAKLDALIETQNARRDGQPGAPGKPQRAAPAPAAKPPAKAAEKEEAKQPGVPCRWQGLWRVALVEHLSGPKLVAKQVDKHLGAGTQAVVREERVAEYATALLFLMLSGETPKAVAKMAAGAPLEGADAHPAVGLLRAAIELATIEQPDDFVARAAQHLSARRIPPELACVLHYAKYGPDGEGGLTVVEALRLLDGYPEEFRAGDAMRELRLAVLDGYARRAWRDERFAEARLLWRETIPLDPFRVSVAHNLALLAARTKAADDYRPAWERATELRYLHAAAAGDVQMLLEERKVLHLSFTQQSYQHYCGQGKSPDGQPTDEELAAWLGNRDALEVWLREWDLYYLNARLRFRSPVHLLGVPRDAQEETLADARDELLRQLESSLAAKPWAGIKTFRQLAEEAIRSAYAHALDVVERTRDPFYEEEKPEADALTREAIERGFLLHRMLGVLAETPGAASVAAACAIARRQFALPWRILQPVCADRGLIERDRDLVGAFENGFINAIAGALAETGAEAAGRTLLADLEACAAILPHRLELPALSAQFLLRAQQYGAAYATAVAALSAARAAPDAEPEGELVENLVTLADNAALMSLPESVRQPQTREDGERSASAGRKALERFPRAGGLRTFVAELLVQLGDEKQVKEAVRLLEEGLPLALTDEQREEFTKLLEKARGEAKAAGVREEIRGLLEGATRRVNEAVGELNREANENNKRRVAGAVKDALRDGRKAKELAARAQLKEDQQQAEEFVRQIADLQSRLSGG